MSDERNRARSLHRSVVNIVFMVDTSGSMSNEIEEIKQSCVAFADTIKKEEFDVRLGLIGFDIGLPFMAGSGVRTTASDTAPPYRVVNLSSYTIGMWPITRPEEFKQNIAYLYVGMLGGAGCYLANSDSVDIFPHVVELFNDTNPNTRVLVIVSDEMGDTSGLKEIVALLNRASLTTYVLGVAGRNGAHELIASGTCGRFWDISKGRYDFRSLLSTVATAIAEESKKKRHFVFARPVFSGDPQRAYSQAWASTHPGCLIVLLDQSGSMKDKFGGTQVGAGQSKADMVATVFNNLLHELVKTNTVGTTVKPRAEIAVLGYEGNSVGSVLTGSFGSTPFGSLPDLAANPLRIETRKRKEVDDDGNIVEVPINFPVWVEPFAGTATPMCAAIERACALAEEWAVTHMNSYPPVVINVTDGASTDGDPTDLAQELVKIYTDHGKALLFNCHITNIPSPSIEFPNDPAELPNDSEHLAQLLFSLSSVIPESARNTIADSTGMTLPSGARGFIFNGDASSVRRMFVFATIGATRIDPNR